MTAPKPKPSVAAQWVIRAGDAIEDRDVQEMTILEKERLSLKDEMGNPRIYSSILECAARKNDIRGVKQALDYLPHMTAPRRVRFPAGAWVSAQPYPAWDNPRSMKPENMGQEEVVGFFMVEAGAAK